MYFNWNDIEDQDELIDELCDGITYLSKDNQLAFLAGLVYNLDFTYDDIDRKVQEMDEDVYEY